MKNIYIDKEEFIFQIQSHSSFPSLLSISDTLTFFNVNNAALNISIEEIDLLPNDFIVLLEGKNNEPFIEKGLYYIKKKKEQFFIKNKNSFVKISVDELKSKWQNIVLLIDKQEENIIISNTNFTKIISCCFLLIFLIYIILIDNTINSKLFLILPIFGFVLSIYAMKDLFGVNFEIIDKICNISGVSSCDSVINSKKWNFFKWFNFSDLSITFFTFQIISLLVVLATNQNDLYFGYLKIMLVFSVPLIFVSIYYQKFIEKKWCPICLLISGVLVTELFFVFSINTSHNFNITSIWLLVLPVTIYFIWIILKKQIENLKELREFKIKANRFIRNYDFFKNNLLSNAKVNVIDSGLILGNKKSKVCITLITNPFCGHCKNAHEIIDSILLKNTENIKVQIIIKTSLDNLSEINKEFFRTIYNLYHQQGIQYFTDSLKYWFKTKDVENWLTIYKTDNSNSIIVDEVYKNINSWCTINNFDYTPVIFINGHEYPNVYERENLVYYIDDLIDDTDFN